MKAKIEEMTLDGDKEYCVAMAKLENLKNRLEGLKSQEADLLEQVRVVNSQNQGHGESVLDQQVCALLAGKDFTASPDLVTLSEKINGLRQKMTIYRKAIEKQSFEVQSHRGRVSSEICGKFLPTHKENNRAILKAIINLYREQVIERRLRFDCEVRNISTGQLIVMSDFSQFGRMDDVQSKIRTVVREYFDRGFISEKEVEKIIEGGMF